MAMSKSRRLGWFSTISALTLPLVFPATPAMAQETAAASDEIIVTATRRAEDIQDVPLNIAVLSGDQLEEQGLSDLSAAGAWVPGVHVVDSGGRTSERIVIRGINADSIGATDTLGNNAGDIVSTYVGDIPLYINMRLEDMERVEFLLGPQGTLYGKGTMGGAIRFLPNRPQFDETTLQIRGDAYRYSEADDLSTDFGGTFNLPITNTLALRVSVDQSNDSGFIDYNYVVPFDQIGLVSSDNFDALEQHEDANYEDTLAGRVGLRWNPTPWFDSNLTYYFQQQDVGARQIGSRDGQIPDVGDYEATARVLEPNDRLTELLALEWTADLGFAELTSATGYSRYTETGQRDQTNLLQFLNYSYELFPNFTAFTRENQEDTQFTQEIRLVSQNDGPFNWIAGAFFSKFETDNTSREFTPYFDEFADQGFPTGGFTPGVFDPRPDNLEYISRGVETLEESAIFGELGYQFTPRWQVTVGSRWYSYDLETNGAADTPILKTVFGYDDPDNPGTTIFYAPDEYNIEFGDPTTQSDTGYLYKLNTSYDFTDDFMAYFTFSQGYRPGGGNGIAPCPVPLPMGQNLCATPEELQYGPDTTSNYEIGAHTKWFDGTLTVNGALFYVEWSNVQLAATTDNGNLPYTTNGSGARSQGIELNFSADITERFNLRGSFTYTDVKLSQFADDLIDYYAPNTRPVHPVDSNRLFEDGQRGDRLPGSPAHQGSLFASYTLPLANGDEVEFNWGASYTGRILTRVGGRGGSAALDSYTVHNASITVRNDVWTAGFYVNNVFDEYYETAIQGNNNSNALVLEDIDGNPVSYRSRYAYVGAPRAVGFRFTRDFSY